MIILASGSPRRKELLSKIVDEFKIVPSNIEENLPNYIEIDKSAEYLAVQKAKEIQSKYPNDIIIGADTIVVVNNKIYGKPINKEHAKEMLVSLSNTTHKVITGVCIFTPTKSLSFSSLTEVTFYNLSEDEINNYLESDEYIGKAGAYAIQGNAGLFVEKINGDYNNVIGLPISKLNRILKNL